MVTDLEGDGVTDIVVAGNEGTVAAYEFRGGALHVKSGWPASTDSGGQSPEARGLAAADLDGDGTVEVVATTTNTSPSGAQVFVFDATGGLFQPEGGHSPAWPRYNQLPGPGNDLRFNQVGNHGYGAYGENVAIGNIDDDPELEIITTFDNHQINAFNLDGTSILASPWFTNRESGAEGKRMGWGQFIRWADPRVERRHYHLHTGRGRARPASLAAVDRLAAAVADLDGDGRNEVIGLPNAELHIPYRTQGYAFMVLDGATATGVARRGGTGASRSCRCPTTRSTAPAATGTRPTASPHRPWSTSSATTGPRSSRPFPVARSTPSLRTATSSGPPKYAPRRSKTFASEVVAADLNKDGRPELVFGTYALHRNAGRLVVLSAHGKKLSVTRLSHQGQDGNGIGVAAAPSIGDLTGNGTLEIVLTTFDHGIDVYTVPGSGTGCLPWPTGRGNILRNGMGPATAP